MVALVEVEGVTKSYDGRVVLDGISFEVAEGEIFGILGPNGAGKTTLMECIEGLRRHDRGRIRVLALDPHHGGPTLRRSGARSSGRPRDPALPGGRLATQAGVTTGRRWRWQG